jgi:hypothetical protein
MSAWIAAFTCCSRNWRRELKCVQRQPRGWLISWFPLAHQLEAD